MKISRRFMRFATIGVINTLVDALVFAILHSGGLSIVLANFISSSIGIGVSLLLNSSYTFRVKSLTRKQIAAFILINVVGLWILQPLAIIALMALLRLLGTATILGSGVFNSSFISSFLATGVTFVWNYTMYARFVYSQVGKQSLRNTVRPAVNRPGALNRS